MDNKGVLVESWALGSAMSVFIIIFIKTGITSLHIDVVLFCKTGKGFIRTVIQIVAHLYSGSDL